MSARANPSFAVRFALVTVAYVLTAKGGLALATYSSSITPIWAPTGIALVAIVIWGPRMWPAVALGALLANAGTGHPAPAVAAIAAGNTLEALAGAWLLARVRFRPDLSRLRDIVALALLAGGASTIVSATIGVASLLSAGTIESGDAGLAWLTWWLGDMGGDLLVAPLLFVLATHDRRGWFARRRVLEALVLGLAAFAAGVLAFSHPAGLIFLTFPVLVWAAMRFRQAGAAAIGFIVACVATTMTAHGYGPFDEGGQTEGLLLAQLFGSVACMAALVLAVVTSERERAVADLRRSHDELEERVRERTTAMTSVHARIAATHELAPVGSWEWDLERDHVTWSEELYAIFGLPHEDHEPSYADYIARVHPDDREHVTATLSRAREDGMPFARDERILRPDGTMRTLLTGAQLLRAEDGRPVRMLGICQDVTDSRRADRALRESQERARLIVDAASQAFISIDEDDVITDWNPAAEQLLGWSAGEALGRPLTETMIPEPDRARHRAALADFLATGHSDLLGRRRPFEALHREGHRISVEVEVAAFKTQDGYSFNAFLQDVSDRTRAERRLVTENAVGRTLLEASSLGEARPRVLEELCRGLGWDYGAWWELDRATGLLLRDATWHSSSSGGGVFRQVSRPATFTVDAGLPGRVWQSGEMLVLAESPPALNGRMLSTAPACGPCRTIGLPIIIRDEVVAVIELAAIEPLALGDDIGATMTRLAQRIARFVERERFEGRLQHLADHDPLTDLFNNRRFEEELARELLAARRYGTTGVVMALDLDNLKRVNDTAGHEAGNELIVRIAQIVRERLRKTDILARIGGDEFAAILPRADENQACQIAAELLDAIREQAVVQTARGACRTTASIGIAVFHDGVEQPSVEELLNEADLAMYDAKEAGRDRVHVFDPQSRGGVRGTWAEQIRGALQDDRFILHAQPIQALHGGGAARHELLVRMLGSDGELIAPAAFMAAAERLDLVQELDRWVVRNAIALLSAREHHDDCFYVNLSARSINSSELLATIARELAVSGADPGRLIFEVTETAAITDVDRARRFVRALHEMGCGFALDDFGTGFASFYNLKHLPFDELKIDGEFVENLTTSPVNQLVVRSIVEIAHGLGKRTVAEWVGDDDTLDLLRSYGVDYAQGFHIGRPASVRELV